MEKNIGRLMSILHRQSQIYFNFVLKDFNITSAEYPLLMYLYKNESATQEEMSNYLNIDKSAIARALKSLEEKEYVLRCKDHEDKRFNKVNLTEKSKNIKDQVRKKVWGWNEILTESIDSDTLDILYHALENMVENIENKNLKKEME